MTHSSDAGGATARLLWVGVIAFVAAVLIRIWTESLIVALLIGLIAGAISIAVVWSVGRTSRPR